MLGFNSLQKGSILHNILEKIYSEITSKEQLQQLKNQKEYIAKHLTSSMSKFTKNGFYDVVFNLFLQKINVFLDIEKTRDNWTIDAIEKTEVVKLGALEFATKIDRVDKISNGEKILFDYKSGKVSKSSWCNGIPDPQLPIYATSDIENNGYSAISFISFKDTITTYTAMAKNTDVLPISRKSHKLCKNLLWEEQLNFWKKHLENTANAFTSGQADINPQKYSCLYCKLQPLCKIEHKL